MTAHPKFDLDNGGRLFFACQPLPRLTYHHADTRGNLIESVPLDVKMPVMMHDLRHERKLRRFFVCPSVFRLENMGRGQPMLAPLGRMCCNFGWSGW